MSGILKSVMIMIISFYLAVNAGVGYKYRTWPDGEVPYKIDPEFTEAHRNLILSAMDMITSKTGGCINYVEKKDSHTHWVDIQIADGCSAKGVGINSVNGPKILKLKVPSANSPSSCMYKAKIIHELFHILGFEHEHTRPDRDEYVTINNTNIKPGKESLFEKKDLRDIDYFGTPYDYLSIMHYPSTNFGTHGRNISFQTITPKKAGIDLLRSSQRTEDQMLTDFDIQAVREMYQCSKNTNETVGQFSFNLVNKMNVHIFIYSRNIKTGKYDHKKTINSEETFPLKSYPGHEWLLLSSGGYKNYFRIGEGQFRNNGDTVEISA